MEADVTEGSGGAWERLHDDWSNRNRVVLKTTDSNVWGGSFGYTYGIKELPNKKTDVAVTIVRDGNNAKGRLLGLVLEPVATVVSGPVGG